MVRYREIVSYNETLRKSRKYVLYVFEASRLAGQNSKPAAKTRS